MSLEMLMQEAAALDEKSQKELLMFLVSLREARWSKQMCEAAKALDDPTTEWITLEEAKERMAKVPEPTDD